MAARRARPRGSGPSRRRDRPGLRAADGPAAHGRSDTRRVAPVTPHARPGGFSGTRGRSPTSARPALALDVLSCKGIAEGVENSNFLLDTDGRHLHPDALREARRRRDLPFFIGLLDHLLAQGSTARGRCATATGAALGTLCGRPAAIVTFLDGVWIKQPAADPLPCARARSGGAAPRRRRLPAARPNACRSRAGPRSSPRPGPGRRGGAGAGGRGRGGARRARRALAARPAGRRDPRRPLSRQRVLPRRPPVGPHRLLLRLHGRLRLRPRDLPQRLVLRARRHLRPRARPGPDAGLPGVRPLVPPRSRPCRCWRAAPRCASC